MDFVLRYLATCFLATSILLPSLACAQEEWDFTLAPYLWTPALSGDTSPSTNAPTASIDLSISDVLSHLNFGAMAVGEARKGRFSILGNAFYSYISEKDDLTVNAANARNIKIGAKTFFAGLGAGYDLYEDNEALITGYAGFRYWDVENELRFSGPLVSFDRTFSESWFDPLIGLGGSYDFGDGFSLQGYADVGGMGVGSDLTWSIMALVGYQLGEQTSAHLGWRYLAVDYDDGGFLFDVELSGPLLGISFRF